MALTAHRQPQAGQIVRAHRDLLGLSRKEFCRRVGAHKRGPGEHPVTLSESTLWWIEEKGVVPYTPRAEAIAAVLGLQHSRIWQTQSSLLASALAERKAA